MQNKAEALTPNELFPMEGKKLMLATNERQNIRMNAWWLLCCSGPFFYCRGQKPFFRC